MQFEFIYGRTREELDEKVERMIAAGWRRFTGVVHVIPSGITSDYVEVPKFRLFFAERHERELNDHTVRK